MCLSEGGGATGLGKSPKKFQFFGPLPKGYLCKRTKMQISGICDSGHKIYLNGFSNFSVEWNCCFYCRSSTHHLFSINLSPEEDPPIYRYFGVKQVIWPIFSSFQAILVFWYQTIFSPFQAFLRIFFSSAIFCWPHLAPTSSGGRRTHSYFEINHFLISLM